MKDCSCYNASASYDHAWPCIVNSVRSLQHRLEEERQRPSRVLVWLTSDDLPKLSPDFYRAIQPLPGVVAATPACLPPPKSGKQAQDSRTGNVDAIAHWWALGASDALVASFTTFSGSAWLRASRPAEQPVLDAHINRQCGSPMDTGRFHWR